MRDTLESAFYAEISTTFTYLGEQEVECHEHLVKVGGQVGICQPDIDKAGGSTPGGLVGLVGVGTQGPEVEGEGVSQKSREGSGQVYNNIS